MPRTRVPHENDGETRGGVGTGAGLLLLLGAGHLSRSHHASVRVHGDADDVLRVAAVEALRVGGLVCEYTKKGATKMSVVRTMVSHKLNSNEKVKTNAHMPTSKVSFSVVAKIN